jgi:hypothetical protein
LARTAFPPDLVLQSIEAGEDHTGDPALWIVFSVRLNGGDLPERGRMRELAAFISDRVGDVIAAGVRSWPYARLTETDA